MTQPILIVAGGTGGHLYPGIALAHALAMRGLRVEFVVRRGDLGAGVLAREGYPVHAVMGQGLPRRLSWKAFGFPFRLTIGSWEARRLIRDRDPAAVVGMGGHLSVPVLVAAHLSGVPTLIHEQNVVPGIANRLLGRLVQKIAVSFEESGRYFPRSRLHVTGLPVRKMIGHAEKSAARQALALNPVLKTFFVFGGSLGARRLNRLLPEVWKSICEMEDGAFQVLHVSGERDLAAVENAYRALPIRAVVLSYCHAMANAYAAADIVICRAGASTIAELIAAQRPAVLVPYPYASANHQRSNAEILVNAGVATMIIEEALSAPSLAQALRRDLAADLPRRFAQLAQRVHVADAAECLAAQVEALVKKL